MVSNFWIEKGFETSADFTAAVEQKDLDPRMLETAAYKIDALSTEEMVYHGRQLAAVCTAIARYSGNPSSVAEANAIRIRSKDHVDGVRPPPKNLKNLPAHPDAVHWLSALLKEFNSLTEMGVVSHGHTRKDVIAMGITSEPIATQVVFENKFKPADHAGKSYREIEAELRAKHRLEKDDALDQLVDSALQLVKFCENGKVTSKLEFDKRKARVVAVGNKKSVTQGEHYFETFASTPCTEASNLLSALVVLLKLKRKAFDIKNAFCWAEQEIKLCLDYPFGMIQRNARGEKLYMILWRNTYGKPDGSHKFEVARNKVWLEKLNQDGFEIKFAIKERSFFYIKFYPSKCENVDLLEAFEKEKKKDPMLVGVSIVHTWMVVHTDDVNMAGQSDAVLDFILDISHKAWKVAEVDPSYMLGVQHLFKIDTKGIWTVEHKMPLYVEGLCATWHEWLCLAGFEKTSPKTPAPSKLVLTLHDPTGIVSEEESKMILRRGYQNLAGGLIWPVKNCFPAALYAINNITTVMSRPSEQAWNYAMHCLAWLRSVKDTGFQFRSDDALGLHAFVDSSLEVDIADGKVRAGHTLRLAGGPLLAKSSKLQRVSYGIPGAEYMQLRNCGADVMWTRDLLNELGLKKLLPGPTEVHCDSTGAIDWAVFGKLTQANKHLVLAYHQIQEWVQDDKAIVLLKVYTGWNLADLMTKNPSFQMVQRFVKWLCGYEGPPEEFLKQRAVQIAKIQREQSAYQNLGTSWGHF